MHINVNRLSLVLVFLFFYAFQGSSQNIALKTNLLYDATTAMNLGIEAALSKKWTLDVSGNYNPWTYSNNEKFKHWLVQPEARYWFCEKFNGHFFGIHAHGGEFNVSKLNILWKTIDMFDDKRYEGWLIGGGISYGYSWILGNHWNIEASIGIGYAGISYDKYDCPKCGAWLGDGWKNYYGITKAAVSVIYIIK